MVLFFLRGSPFLGTISTFTFRHNYPIVGAVNATCVDSVDAKSSGKLCAFLSCITSKPRLALFTMSAHVGTTLPLLSTMD